MSDLSPYGMIGNPNPINPMFLPRTTVRQPVGMIQNESQIGGLFRMMKAASNPMAYLQNQFSQTQIGQAMDMVKQNDGDAKTAFYNLAKQKGVNPDDILNQLR